MPNVTIRADVLVAIHSTLGSSPLRTATPSGRSASTILAFSARVTSNVGSDLLWSLPIDVTTTMSGSTILAKPAILPGPPIPTSSTACWCHGRIRRRLATMPVL
jgi:hypothetical protein